MKPEAIVSTILMVGLLGGCHGSAREVDSYKRSLVIAGDHVDQAWDEILDVLRDHNFEPDRQDHRAGIITTHPTVSQQWFEFWRADAPGLYQWCESSLHNIRRWVEVKFEHGSDAQQTVLTLTVHIERKAQPQRQVTTASGALQIYRDKVPTYAGEQLSAKEAVRWVDVGTDSRLEQYLLQRMERRLSVEDANCP